MRPGADSAFTPRALAPDSAGRLVRIGFLTNALNPKMAVFYLSLFPQFVHPEIGSVFLQGLLLGLTQMVISFSANLGIICVAGSLAGFFANHPRWIRTQRWLMGGVLGALACRLAMDERK